MVLCWVRGVSVCLQVGGVGLFEQANHLIMVNYAVWGRVCSSPDGRTWSGRVGRPFQADVNRGL